MIPTQARSLAIGVVTTLFILAIVFLSIRQSRNIIIGPILDVEGPRSGEVISDSLVEVRGSARNISALSLNDRQIFVDEKGFFSEKLLVPYGYTIMMLRAKDRFGRETSKSIELVYQ